MPLPAMVISFKLKFYVTGSFLPLQDTLSLYVGVYHYTPLAFTAGDASSSH